jgi:hypothetical protein
MASPRTEAVRNELSALLRDVRARLAAPEADFSTSSWSGQREALEELDGILELLGRRLLRRDRAAIRLLFSPTGPVQEVAERGLWGQEFLDLAAKADGLLGDALAAKGPLPQAADFPAGTEFVIKEFDVPLAHVPGRGWENWFGGKPRPYDAKALRVDNNWPAESFDEWLEVVESSLA